MYVIYGYVGCMLLTSGGANYSITEVDDLLKS